MSPRYTMLDVSQLTTGWRGGPDVIKDVELRVGEHEIVTVLGSNGAGKTTLLSVVAGLLQPRAGRITFEGEDIGGLPAHRMVERGLAMVPSGRKMFGDQSVVDNLLIGAHRYRRDRTRATRMVSVILDRFPKLAARRNQLAGSLSGGEQQMLAIGRGLMSRPRMMMLDEPSMGLDPESTNSIFELITRLRDEGVTFLVVEKLAHLATALSDRITVMQLGRVTLSGPASQVAGDPRVEEAYLGARRS